MEPVSLSGLLASFLSFVGGFDFRLSEGTYSATNIAALGNRTSELALRVRVNLEF